MSIDLKFESWKKHALFLDRDGVINIDHGYVYLPENFDFLPGIFELGRHAIELGYLIVIITNQAGIGRGYYSESDFHNLTHWMIQRFNEQGVPVAKVYHCPDHPEHGLGDYKQDSWRRKPNPGMIEDAVRELGVSTAFSVLIGDKHSDIECARRAGIRNRLLIDKGCSNNQDFISISSLYEAIPLLTEFSKALPAAKIGHQEIS